MLRFKDAILLPVFSSVQYKFSLYTQYSLQALDSGRY